MTFLRNRVKSKDRNGLFRLLLSFGVLLALIALVLLKQFPEIFTNAGWQDGFNHPLAGWDHLLTMVAVGIWAAQMRGRAVWMLPLAFVSVISLGGLAGAAGLAIPHTESIIVLSCAVFCILIGRNIRFSSNVNVLIVAFFAFFHGLAHGQEISVSDSLMSYTLGFVLATLLLHGAGILFAKLMTFAVGCLLAALVSHSALAANASASAIARPGNASTDQPLAASVGLRSANGVESLRRRASVSRAESCQANKVELRQCASAALCLPAPRRLIREAVPYSGFKQRYPAINHTPGSPLLSNGVGLTSPPLSGFQKPTSQVVSKSCNTAISDTEERALHRKILRYPLDEFVIDSGHSSHDVLFACANAAVAISCPQPYLLLGAEPLLACANLILASAWTSWAIFLSAVTADTNLQPEFVGSESMAAFASKRYLSSPVEPGPLISKPNITTKTI